MNNQSNITYIDFQGNALSNHNGKLIPIDEKTGIQYFDIDGKGFIHDGSPIKMNNGKMQFFLHDGTAIIHDGSPIKLPNGQTQFFNEKGYAIWPIDLERATQLNTEQRNAFFKERIQKISKTTPLTEAEAEDLRLAFLAAERSDSEESKNISWCKDIHSTGAKPISDETAYMLMTLEVIWLRVWTKYQLRHKEWLAARYVINLQKKSGCTLAGWRSSESMLVDELALELKKAEKAVQPPTNFDKSIDFEINDKGILKLDERLNKYVKTMRQGEGTERCLGFLKAEKGTSTKNRARCWQKPLYLHRCIADIVWFNSVKEMAGSAYKKPPALTIFAWDVVTTPFKAKELKAIENQIFDEKNRQIGKIKLLDPSDLSTIDVSTISNILAKRNIELLKSVNFHRLFRWEIKEVTKRYLSGVADFRKLTIDDSFKNLAVLISASTNPKTLQELREIVAWQQQAVFDLGDGNMGHMLTYDIRSNPNDRRKKILSLYLTDMLLPNFVFSMPHQNQSQREARMLAPLLDMPPLVTDNNKLHAAQAAFQVELCIEMRKRAKEIVDKGGIYLPHSQKVTMAETVGLDLETLPKVFDRWTQDGNDGPKMLEEITQDVYNLSEHHQAARDFIISAGKMEKSASIAGQKSRKRKK